jgi:ABC-type transporter Mla subunit MlaD
MSLSNISTALPSVEKFIQRTSAAEKSQQKEIRITIQEARELTTELASMTAKLGKTVQEIHQLLVEIKDSTTKIDVKFDGGGFGS